MQYKYLGTVIDDKLEWTANMEACYKKANQRMHFLRKLKNFKLNSNILYLFFQSVLQSIMLCNQICYYSNARKADTERLDRKTSAARKLTRRELQSLTAICREASPNKFMRLSNDTTQPLYHKTLE